MSAPGEWGGWTLDKQGADKVAGGGLSPLLHPRQLAHTLSCSHSVSLSLLRAAAYMGPKTTSRDGYDLGFQVTLSVHYNHLHLLFTRSHGSVRVL